MYQYWAIKVIQSKHGKSFNVLWIFIWSKSRSFIHLIVVAAVIKCYVCIRMFIMVNFPARGYSISNLGSVNNFISIQIVKNQINAVCKTLNNGFEYPQ